MEPRSMMRGQPQRMRFGNLKKKTEKSVYIPRKPLACASLSLPLLVSAINNVNGMNGMNDTK